MPEKRRWRERKIIKCDSVEVAQIEVGKEEEVRVEETRGRLPCKDLLVFAMFRAGLRRAKTCFFYVSSILYN